MRPSIYSYSFVLFLVFSGALCALTPQQLAQIDSVVNNVFIPGNNVTGMSLSIVMNGQTVLSKGYGKMDIDNGLPAQNDTLFSIGSISKSFIATLVVKTLSEKYPVYGESILDVPISQLNPNFNNFNLTFSDRFRAEEISFRDLLSHRTCLIGADQQLTFANIPTATEYNYRTRYQKQDCGHRSGFLYNIALYSLVGEIIASFEGKSLETLVRNFMVEIGMENSTTIDVGGSYEDLPNMSQGYYQRDGHIGKLNQKLLRRIATGLGTGGILSTSNDMAKYAAFHLNKGRVGDKQVISEEAMSWLYKPSIIVGPLAGKQSENEGAKMEPYAYGLGFLLSMFDGYSLISHDGYWPSFQSNLALFPAKDLGIFTVTNGPGFLIHVTHFDLGSAIFDIIRGSQGMSMGQRHTLCSSMPHLDLDHTLNPTRNFKRISFIEREALRKMEFENVTGIYGEEQAGEMRVSVDEEDNNFLQVRMPGEWGTGRLLPVNGSDTKFLIEWKTDIMEHFYTYPPEWLPLPQFHIEFRLNSLYFLMYEYVIVVYVRNATIDTFPAIPWDPTSCGPYST